MKKFMIFVIVIMIIGAFTIPSFADTYNAELEMWENGEEIPTDLSDNELYDWQIEHGMISEAREQYCPNCSVWAKYGTCPICNKIVWGNSKTETKIEIKNSVSTQKISAKSTKQKKTVKKSKAKKTVKKSKVMTDAKAKRIIMKKKKIHIDKIKLVDKYVKGKWYCYYIYADGDCYVATIKRGKVQKFVQLN